MSKNLFKNIFNNPKQYINNEKLICEFTNVLLDITDNMMKLLDSDNIMRINNKYNINNKRCDVNNYNQLELLFMLSDPSKDKNLIYLDKLIKRYIDIVKIINSKTKPESIPETKPEIILEQDNGMLLFRNTIDMYIKSFTLDQLLTRPDFFIDNVVDEPIYRVVKNDIDKQSIIPDKNLLLGTKTDSNDFPDFLQRKFFFDKITDMISVEEIYKNEKQDLIFNFQYLVNSFFNNFIDNYIVANGLKNGSIIFLFKGGTTMQIIFNKYKKIIDNNKELFNKLSNFFARSDSDYAVFIDQNIYDTEEKYNKIYYDMNKLIFNILQQIKTFLQENKKYILPLDNIKPEVLSQKIKNANELLNANKVRLTYFKDVEKFIGITFDQTTIMTEEIPERFQYYEFPDNGMNGADNIDVKKSKFMKKGKLDTTRTDFIVTSIKQNLKANTVIFSLPNKNKSDGIYNYFNETNYFSVSNNQLNNFLLHRMKINSIYYFKTVDGKYGFINMPSELIDIPISKFNDFKINKDSIKFSIDFKKYSHNNNNAIINYNSYSLNGFINDLYKQLFIEVKLPWSDPKFEKKINRVIFLILILLNNKYKNTKSFIDNFREYLTSKISKNQLLNIDMIKIDGSIEKLSNESSTDSFINMYDDLKEKLISALQNDGSILCNENMEKFKAMTKLILDIINIYNPFNINTGYFKIPEEVPFLDKYLKYKNKYMQLKKQL